MLDVVLVVAYVLIAALVLNLWIATRWSVGVKVGLVIFVSLLYMGTYAGIKELRGWPTTEPLPEAFHFVWAKIDQPDKRMGYDGQIYLWVQKLTDDNEISGAPRSHQLPYTIQLAEKIEKAMRDTENGEQLSGRSGRNADKDLSDSSKLPDAKGSDVTYFEETPIVLQFQARAKATLPEKTL